MTSRLDATAFASSAAVIAAVVMLLLGIFGNLGVYAGAVDMMEQWHLFFDLSAVGILAGMVEAAIVTFVFCWAFVALYNRLLGRA